MKAYHYRIYPNTSQIEQFNKHFGCVRYIYNWGLAKKINCYKEEKENISRFDLQREMVHVLKKQEDTKWLNEVNAQSLQSALLNLDNAYKNFFRRVKQKENPGFPKFKSRYHDNSFQCPQRVKVDFDKGVTHIPKIKDIKTIFDRTFEGKIKTTTIKKVPSGKYFISILVDDGIENPKKAIVVPKKTLGLDLRLTNLITYSNGQKTENIKPLDKHLKILAIEQRKLANKKKGSKNREKQRLRVARVHERIKNIRNDYIQKITTNLVNQKNITTFAVESLGIKEMQKNKQLSRMISDASWSMLINTLEYKCNWKGKNIIKIDRFTPTSKMCSKCGHILDLESLRIPKIWKCPKCNTQHDRSINAAINIKNIALDQYQNNK